MFKTFALVVLFGVWFEAALGMFPPRAQVPKLGLNDEEMISLVDAAVVKTGTGTFTQPIDHGNSSVGTFSQAYWYNATYWTPGAPVC